MKLIGVAIVASLALAGMTTGVRAELVALKGDLKSSNEVPPNSSTGTGTAEATFDTTSKTLTWTVSFADLSGPVIGAHFHGPSDSGKNAGIALPFQLSASPIKGSAVLNDTQSADLLAGKWYANIHTQKNPGGEIRGQMTR